MTELKLKKIALYMVNKGYIDTDTIRYCDDLYDATEDEIEQCLEYVDECCQIGCIAFERQLK